MIAAVFRKHQRRSCTRKGLVARQRRAFSAWQSVPTHKRRVETSSAALARKVSLGCAYDALSGWREVSREIVAGKIAGINRQLSLDERDRDKVHAVLRAKRGDVKSAVHVLESAQEEALVSAMEGAVSAEQAKLLLSASGRNLKCALGIAQERALESAAEEHRVYALKRHVLYGVWRMVDVRKRRREIVRTVQGTWRIVQQREALLSTYTLWKRHSALYKRVRKVHPKCTKMCVLRTWGAAARERAKRTRAGTALAERNRVFVKACVCRVWSNAVAWARYLRAAGSLAGTLRAKVAAREVQACFDGA